MKEIIRDLCRKTMRSQCIPLDVPVQKVIHQFCRECIYLSIEEILSLIDDDDPEIWWESYTDDNFTESHFLIPSLKKCVSTKFEYDLNEDYPLFLLFAPLELIDIFQLGNKHIIHENRDKFASIFDSIARNIEDMTTVNNIEFDRCYFEPVIKQIDDIVENLTIIELSIAMENFSDHFNKRKIQQFIKSLDYSDRYILPLKSPVEVVPLLCEEGYLNHSISWIFEHLFSVENVKYLTDRNKYKKERYGYGIDIILRSLHMHGLRVAHLPKTQALYRKNWVPEVYNIHEEGEIYDMKIIEPLQLLPTEFFYYIVDNFPSEVEISGNLQWNKILLDFLTNRKIVSCIDVLKIYKSDARDISFVLRFSPLVNLIIHKFHSVENFDVLGKLYGLKLLTIHSTALVDISWISNLQSLQLVSFVMCNMESIEPLKDLHYLKYIALDQCKKIQDIDIVGEMDIVAFSTDFMNFTDLSFLQYAHSLEKLHIHNNLQLKDIGPILGLQELRSLSVKGCINLDLEITDIAYLSGLKTLSIHHPIQNLFMLPQVSENTSMLHYRVLMDDDISKLPLQSDLESNQTYNSKFKGFTPIFYATGCIAYSGAMLLHRFSHEIVNHLFENGADINFRDDHVGLTPLHVASIGRSFEGVDLLISLGGDTTMTDNHKKNCLHHVLASYANPFVKTKIIFNIVRKLLEFSCGIDDYDEDGYTPFHYAQMSNPELAYLLFMEGANIHKKQKLSVYEYEEVERNESLDWRLWDSVMYNLKKEKVSIILNIASANVNDEDKSFPYLYAKIRCGTWKGKSNFTKKDNPKWEHKMWIPAWKCCGELIFKLNKSRSKRKTPGAIKSGFSMLVGSGRIRFRICDIINEPSVYSVVINDSSDIIVSVHMENGEVLQNGWIE
eukprot:TRINITY_DN1741_c0_g1_i1.p1 TRINITY_DN1741_c0_g1~~TRINITY_DN1741_c0_g1_i1.p1  ORF type:complete len:1013 (-),score=186.91 TRINITY_DN1741_c0_g1_i1:1511-4192(-)